MRQSKYAGRRRTTGRAQIDIDFIIRALAEDAPSGDITTSATVPPGTMCHARLVAKESLVIAGMEIFRKVFKTQDAQMKVTSYFRDGQSAPKGAIVAKISGPASSALIAERTALNFLQRMCGVATLTKKFVKAVEGTGAVILDTRKTIPGWRDLDKYAVLCGGGENHRRDLSEMILVKENHCAMAGGVKSATMMARKTVGPEGFVEVEARTLKETRSALEAGANRILLDNMTPARVRKAVQLVAGKAQTEASGNMTLKTVKAYAMTGVDYISVGALTHSAPAADLSLIME